MLYQGWSGEVAKSGRRSGGPSTQRIVAKWSARTAAEPSRFRRARGWWSCGFGTLSGCLIDFGRGEVAKMLVGPPVVVTVEPGLKPQSQRGDGGVFLEVDFVVGGFRLLANKS